VFRQIADLGYENILLKLNAKHYGIPQNRDRIFVLSIRKGYEANYSKPKPIDLKLRLKDMLEDEVDASFYLSDKMMAYMVGSSSSGAFDRSKVFKPHDKNSKYANTITTYANDRPTDNFVIVPEDNQKGYAEAYEGDGVYIDWPHQKRGTVQRGMIQTLSTTPHTDVGVVVGIAQRGRENGQEFELNGGEFANAITTVQKDSMIATTQCINSKVNGKQPKVQDRIYDEQGISTTVTTSFMPSVLNQLQIRKLTPRETWRLMGFDDSDFDRASAIHSNSTLYKQAGNSIVVNVLEHILKGLFYEPNTV
jgi:DNA (cytosine-5)-methyltransferase 1